MTHQPISKLKQEVIPALEHKLTPIVKNALALKIENEFDLGTGVEILSELNRINDRISEEKERITKPLLEALKVERSRWKPIEQMNQTGIDAIRGEMSRYQTDLINKQKELDTKLSMAVEEGEIDLEQALSVSEQQVSSKYNTPLGKVTFIETKKFEVMDVTMLPVEYIQPNEELIRKAMKEGVELPGVRYYTEQVPKNYR